MLNVVPHSCSQNSHPQNAGSVKPGIALAPEVQDIAKDMLDSVDTDQNLLSKARLTEHSVATHSDAAGLNANSIGEQVSVTQQLVSIVQDSPRKFPALAMLLRLNGVETGPSGSLGIELLGIAAIMGGFSASLWLGMKVGKRLSLSKAEASVGKVLGVGLLGTSVVTLGSYADMYSTGRCLNSLRKLMNDMQKLESFKRLPAEMQRLLLPDPSAAELNPFQVDSISEAQTKGGALKKAIRNALLYLAVMGTYSLWKGWRAMRARSAKSGSVSYTHLTLPTSFLV